MTTMTALSPTAQLADGLTARLRTLAADLDKLHDSDLKPAANPAFVAERLEVAERLLDALEALRANAAELYASVEQLTVAGDRLLVAAGPHYLSPHHPLLVARAAGVAARVVALAAQVEERRQLTGSLGR